MYNRLWAPSSNTSDSHLIQPCDASTAADLLPHHQPCAASPQLTLTFTRLRCIYRNHHNLEPRPPRSPLSGSSTQFSASPRSNHESAFRCPDSTKADSPTRSLHASNPCASMVVQGSSHVIC